MQKDANTILLFTEHRAAIDYLSDEDAGKLIKALFAYVDVATKHTKQNARRTAQTR